MMITNQLHNIFVLNDHRQSLYTSLVYYSL